MSERLIGNDNIIIYQKVAVKVDGDSVFMSGEYN